MRKLYALLGLFGLMFLSACSDVPAGHVGVKVYLLGGSKGVDHEVLGVGRYWIGMNEQLYLFPTAQQNYTWTKSPHEGKAVDESITFQTKEGLEINADVGITYHIDPDKVSIIFQKYRKGVEEITSIYLRNYVRDAFNSAGSTMAVEEAYGPGKTKMMAAVTKEVVDQISPQGIVVDKLYLIGKFRLPENVETALNSKIEATQRAQQRQNEVAEATAAGAKEIATAHAHAMAQLEIAHAEADANKLKQATLTEALIRYQAIQKWNGELPTYTGGGALPFINMNSK